MKYAIGPRREIGIRTIFNMLGPLTNPAGATAQLIGFYEPRLTEMFAGVLKKLGTKRAFVVHGADGLDEATVTGETRVSELKEGLVTTYNIDPMELFGESFAAAELLGGDAEANARITTEILSGETGARRGIVVLNAALAIVAGGKAGTVREGIAVAEACINSGSALKKLQALIERSHS
jgi:anthranilate phosphoribosyltransferase